MTPPAPSPSLAAVAAAAAAVVLLLLPACSEAWTCAEPRRSLGPPSRRRPAPASRRDGPTPVDGLVLGARAPSCGATSSASSTDEAPSASVRTKDANGSYHEAEAERTSARSPPHRSGAHSLHLVSLPPRDPTYSSPASESLVRECWRWKDESLGDGRDYFVPKPRALKAFQGLFVGMEVTVRFDALRSLEVTLKLPSNDGEESRAEVTLPLPKGGIAMAQEQQSSEERTARAFVIEECAALSNCARLDVMLSLRTTQQPKGSGSNGVSSQREAAEAAARCAVAYHLHRQVDAHKSKRASLLQLSGLASRLDLPGAIDLDARSSHIAGSQREAIRALARRLDSLEGARDISTHLSMVAAGLAPRPDRPDREVLFRPYSSRDAHVLLQLKRTAEVVSAWDGQSRADESTGGTRSAEGTAKGFAKGGRGRIKTLLDGALSAGKAARNEHTVPEIVALKGWGSDGTPDAATAKVAARAAIDRAVNPRVEDVVERLAAMDPDAAGRISTLRARVHDVVASLDVDGDALDLRATANRLLHTPTMRLREGTMSEEEVEREVERIEGELRDVVRTP